jgi:hypothetical protein
LPGAWGREVEVTKTGRNDPCPCGSGKKYKYCCLKKEAEGKSEAIGRDRAWDTVIGKLLDFSREDQFRQELLAGFDLFWNKSYTIDQVNSLEPMEVMSFLDWFAHDHRTVADGKRIVEVFLEERGPTLPRQERELLELERLAWMSAFEVKEVNQGETVGLLDVFQDIDLYVQHTPSLQGVSVGQLLLARVAAAGELHRFSWINALVPPELEDEFKAYVQEMFSAYQEEHYQASWAQFLQERSYLFNHFLLKVSGRLAAPRILLPFQEAQERAPRPAVLTPDHVQPEERPAVLVPGQRERRPAPKVLVPGRDT